MADIVILFRSVSREAEAVALRPLLGVPLFLRNMLVAAQAGITRFGVIAPAHLRRQILKTWHRYAAGRGLHMELITCRPEHRLTKETIGELRGIVSSRFLLLDANSIVTEKWMRDRVRPALNHGRPITGPARLLTKREIDLWNANLPVEGVRTQDLLNMGALATSGSYTIVERFSATATASKFLCEQIRKSATGWVARHINKRLSLPISRPLARLRVHPHTITAFNMLVGLAAGIGTGGMTYVGLLAGAILFQLASILDGCDGEVAKLTFRTSKFGQYIDTVSDNFALVSFMTGLVIHQYRAIDEFSAFVWGGILASGVVTLLAIMINYLRKNTDSASLVTFEKEYLGRLLGRQTGFLENFVRVGKFFLKKDCFSFIALCFAIAGVLPVWLYMASAVVWIGIFSLVALRYRTAPARDALPSAALAIRRHSDAR